MPYAQYWYLEIVSKGKWDVLVYDDYKAVFPLPWNRKYILFRQIYQPAFCQQLGWFGNADVVKKAYTSTWVKIIKQYFPKGYLQTNYIDVPYKKRLNLILNLNQSFEAIRKKYSSSVRKNIRKHYVNIKESKDIKKLYEFYHKNLSKKFTPPPRSVALALFQQAIELNQGFILSAFEQENMVASVFFLRTPSRIIFLFGSSNQQGRKTYAMHTILNFVFERYSNSDITFDFEGSELSGVKAFFKSFGAVEQPYGKYIW